MTAELVPVVVQIPAGCQVNHVVQLEGKGVRKMDSCGDHYAHIKIRGPK